MGIATSDSSAINIYSIRGVLGEISGPPGVNIVYPLGSAYSNGGEIGYYSNNFSTFTLTGYKPGSSQVTGFCVFGFKSADDVLKSKVTISYTPAYGGSKQGIFPLAKPGDQYFLAIGSGLEVFRTDLYGLRIPDFIQLNFINFNH